MIRVTIEMLPNGDESKKYTMQTLEIVNEGTGDDELGNYKCRLTAEYTRGAPRTGKVREFPRRRNSVWSLVGAFLKLFGHTKHSPKKMQRG